MYKIDMDGKGILFEQNIFCFDYFIFQTKNIPNYKQYIIIMNSKHII